MLYYHRIDGGIGQLSELLLNKFKNIIIWIGNMKVVDNFDEKSQRALGMEDQLQWLKSESYVEK